MKYIIIILILVLMPFLPLLLNRIFGINQKPVTTEDVIRKQLLEARKILEVGDNAREEEIKAAHIKLIQKNHPDAGGTKYLASKINEARDILLNNLKKS